ncbi:MAG TPA: hypothetical protein VFC73_01410 [Syntrophomonadaceae bacterium]|nr:hypothetical protein [Syntrophomonadaceae bacterium]
MYEYIGALDAAYVNRMFTYAESGDEYSYIQLAKYTLRTIREG